MGRVCSVARSMTGMNWMNPAPSSCRAPHRSRSAGHRHRGRGRPPSHPRVLFAAAVVTAGSAAAQLGGGTGMTWSGTGLLLSAGALGGAAGTSLLAAPVLPRLGALAVTIYSCGLAGILLLAAAAVARSEERRVGKEWR